MDNAKSAPKSGRSSRAGSKLRSTAIGAICLLGISSLPFIEARFDAQLTARLGVDWTPLVARLEGDVPGRVQAWTPAALAVPLGCVYLALLPTYLAAGAIALRRARPALLAWIFAPLIGYLLALPFYVFVPVSEPAWSGLSTAEPWLEHVRPGATRLLRAGSALDNGIPSLHVAAALAAAGIAHAFKHRMLAGIGLGVALLVAWSTLALGIHWLTDLIVAVPFAALTVRLASRASRRFEQQSATPSKSRRIPNES